MVSHHQETDFNFPFISYSTRAAQGKFNFDDTDRKLAFVACLFFFSTLLLISLDGIQKGFYENPSATGSLQSKTTTLPQQKVNLQNEKSSNTKPTIQKKEINSENVISQINIPWINSTLGITDSTINFQLDPSLPKRKKKNADYVIEVFHNVNI